MRLPFPTPPTNNAVIRVGRPCALLTHMCDSANARGTRYRAVAEASCLQETEREQYELINWLADAVFDDIVDECAEEVSSTIDVVAEGMVQTL